MNRKTLFCLFCLCLLAITARAQSPLAEQMQANDVRNQAQSPAISTAAGDAQFLKEFEALTADKPAVDESQARQVETTSSVDELFNLENAVKLTESNEPAAKMKRAPRAPYRVRMAEDATYFEFDYANKTGERLFKGTPQMVLTSDTTAVIYKLWGLPDTLQAAIDLDAATIKITPACVYNHSTYGEIWAAKFTSSGYSLKNPITGTINEDGSINLDGWCLVIIAGDYKGYGYGFYSKAEWKLPNATMENVHYDGTSVDNVDSVYTYPVYISQTYDNMLSIANFAKAISEVNVRISSDSTWNVPPQTIFTNAMYGNFLINPASWATSKAAQKGNLVSTDVQPTEVDFGNWGVFNESSTTLRSLGVISSRLIFANGLFTYPEPKTLDWSGEGTEASPYIITTPEQMLAFAEAVNNGNSFTGKYIVLGNDIDMSSITSAYIAVGDATNTFNGNFNGQNYSIKNLTIEYGVEPYCGVFGYADSTSVIKNLTVDGITLNSQGEYAGGVVAYSCGSLSNLKVDNATITHENATGGGIVGAYYMGSGFDGGYFNGTMSGYGDTGGCIGLLQASDATNLESHGSVKLAGLKSTFNRGLGGVVGRTILRNKTYAKLTNSYNAAMIQSSSSYAFVGGIVGNFSSATAEHCYNAGPISVSFSYSSSATYYGYAGGAIGCCYGGTIKDCYNSGTLINGKYSPLVGGFVGYVMTPMKSSSSKDGFSTVTYSYTSSLTNCFNSGQVSQTMNYDVQGFYGKTYADSVMHNCIYDFQVNATELPDTSTIISMQTAEMTSGTLMSGFSSDTWTAAAGFYPVLKNFSTSNDLNLSKAPVTFADGDNVKQVKKTFKISTDNDIHWYLYSNSSYVTESDGLKISGDSVTLKNVDSREILAAISSDGKLIKLYNLVTINPNAFEGSGTEDDPFLIRTKSDMLTLDGGVRTGQAYKGLYFKQMNDIDLGANDSTADFTGVAIGGISTLTFGGIFDGNGFSFHNYTPNTIVLAEDGTLDKTNSTIAVALFGMVNEDGVIKNVTLASDCEVRGYQYASGIAAVNYGKVYNCKNYGKVISATSYAGGIVAAGQAGSTIEQCYNAGTILASGFYAGGIAAYTAGNVIYNQNDGEVLCDSIYPGTKWKFNAYAGGITSTVSGTGDYIGNINTGHIVARKNAGGLSYQLASSTATVKNNINYGMVDETVSDPATRGTMTATTPNSKLNLANNYYDSQIGYYGAAATATFSGFEAKLTREFTAGTPFDSIMEPSRFDWTAGLYPVIKAFKDEPMAAAHRKMVVTFGDEQTADDILNDATLKTANDLTWTTQKATNFVVNGGTLKVTITEDTTSLRDTLTATVGTYTKVIPLRAMPKIFEGSGTKEDPFQIRNKHDMLKLAEYTNEQSYPFTNRYFIVLNDIDFDTTEYIVVGLNDAQFNAYFDGNGKTFYNINNTVTSTQDCRGMFGNLGPNGTLYNFTLASGTITGYRYNGAIVGKCYGKVLNVVNYAKVTTSGSSGAGAAGIAGQIMDGGLVKNCTNYGEMAPTGMNAAGIAYKMLAGSEMDSCYNRADITGSKTGYAGIVAICAGKVTNCENFGNISAGGSSGGVVASASSGAYFRNCHNHGDVTGKATMGGFIAATTKPSTSSASPIYIHNCSNEGKVTGTGTTGGFAANLAAGVEIIGCENSGDVEGTGTSANFGGFVANLASATDYLSRISYSYNTGNVTTKSQYTGGFVGKTVKGDEFVHCGNTGDVYSTNKFVGGFAGNMTGTATECFNTGDVKADNFGVGGFAGLGSGTINCCVNTGNVTSTTGTQEGGVAGGLWAYGQTQMYNSYNMGNVKASGSTGGLTGGIYDGFLAQGCYNAGNIEVTDSTYLGHIAPNPLKNRQGTYTNVYYDNIVNHDMAISEVDKLCTGLSTNDMTFIQPSDSFVVQPGMYPTLKCFQNIELLNWFAAVPVFSDGDTPTNVNGPFIIGTPEGTEWTTSDNLNIVDGKVYCSETGDGWVKKTYAPTGADLSPRRVKLNAEGEEETKVYEFTYYVTVYQTSSSVVDLMGKNLVETVYYDLQGHQLGNDRPSAAGIYIQVGKYNDGSIQTQKILIK